MKVHLLYTIDMKYIHSIDPKFYAIYATREMAEEVGKLLMEDDRDLRYSVHSYEVIE